MTSFWSRSGRDSLHLAIRDEVDASEDSAGKVPFLWVTTDRQHSVSETAKQFFPPALSHVLSVDSGLAESRMRQQLT